MLNSLVTVGYGGDIADTYNTLVLGDSAQSDHTQDYANAMKDYISYGLN